MRKSGRRVFWPFVLAVLSVPAFSPPSARAFVVFDPPMFWDCNDDAVADDTCLKYRQYGAGWTVGGIGRVNDAIEEWSTDTQFDPVWLSTATKHITKDRLAPFWCLDQDSWQEPGEPIIIAATCIRWIEKHSPFEYNDIFEGHIYLNHVPNQMNPPRGWWTGLGAPPADNWHMGGVLVHEMGHLIFLGHSACPPGPTMCATATPADTFTIFTLHADDIAGANYVY